MSRHWRIYHQTMAAVQVVGISVVLAFSNPSRWTLLNVGLLITHVSCLTYSYLKEKRNGQHRRTEEGPSDPGDFTFTFNPGTSYLAFGAFSAASTNPSLSSGGAVEHVESDMPILAHRIAKLSFAGRSKPFVPLTRDEPFGVEGDAECIANRYFSFARLEKYDEHEAPALHCTCGFHAVPVDVEPWDEGTSFVTLMVELSGTVIEHERGYRSQHQRVVECRVPACPYCGRQADVVLVESQTMRETACRKHLPSTMPEGVVTVDVDDLAGLVRVPVSRAGAA